MEQQCFTNLLILINIIERHVVNKINSLEILGKVFY